MMAACCLRPHNDGRPRHKHIGSRHLLCSSRDTNKTTTVNMNQSANLISAPAISAAISPFVAETTSTWIRTTRGSGQWRCRAASTNKWLLVVLVCLSALVVGLSRGQLADHRRAHQARQDDNHLDLYLDDKDLLLAASGGATSLDLLAAAAAASTGGGGQQRQNQQPGHYEFDVAPKMEPPSVRKPPYRQTDQQCPGSDLLGGFSPKDTLCGDLNQGRVPQNPLGQSVADQSYPFELIKNKTLQFLARALPVLKLEYETIPKVARYLPGQQLLNPTSLQSPLGHDHFDELNQRFAVGQPASGQLDLQAPPFVRRRRRAKRSPSVNRQQQQQVSVAEMTPNVSLVVSSAHSATGKIHSKRSEVITRDGLRQLPAGSPHTSGARPAGQLHLHEGFVVGPTIQSGHHDDHNNGQVDSHAAKQPLGATAANHATNGRPDASSDIKSPGHTVNGQVQARSSPEERQASAQSSKQVDTGTLSSSSSSSAADRRKLDCGQLGNPIVSTVCQTAAALIEGEKAPAWVQAAKLIGNIYSSPSSSSSSSSSSSPSADIWSLLGLLTSSGDHGTDAKSSAGAKSASNLWSYLSPFASSFSAGGGGTSTDSGSSLSGREQPASDTKASTSTSVAKKQDKQASTFGQLNVSTLAGMALAGWATTALAGLVQYFVPSAFSTSSGQNFARRKKPFDPTETFVDTPASLAALSAIQQAKQSPLSASLVGKQPPTPCPSMEEYISPTFARNYQGAWKYVVQIPHEGYFTQTIQRSSCMRSKCEFTDGVCHEAPRWVSLLVAEIYYPNAVFGTSGSSAELATATRNTNNLATAQSSSHSQQVALGHQPQLQPTQPLQQPQQQQPSLRSVNAQDPLQMTDSLNTYNHNLNSALYNAASQLGLDPSNMNQMQQLAEAHNYQLLQRNGLLSAESRAGQPVQVAAPQAKQQYQQQQQPAAAFDANNHEYIKALAIETLRQNPHLTVDDIIKSLQMQTSARRKRDLGGQQQQHHQPASYNIHRSSVESGQSLNELAAYSNQIQQQQQLTAMKHNEQVNSVPSQAQASLPVASIDQPLDAQQASPPPPNRGQQVGQHQQQQQQQQQPTNQVECDGHDKIGCYVVRVYYDWFLVNGSCKCWRTQPGNSNSGQQAAGSQQSAAGNSFLRRIFTG